MKCEEIGLLPASSEMTGNQILNWIRQKELFPFTNRYETVGRLHRSTNPTCNFRVVTTVVSTEKESFGDKTNIFLYLNNKNKTARFDPVSGSPSGQEILYNI